MTTRDRWDETRAIIEAGQKVPVVGPHMRVRYGRTKYRNVPFCQPRDLGGYAAVQPAQTDWDDTKQAQHDAERQIYGGLGTPQRED